MGWCAATDNPVFCGLATSWGFSIPVPHRSETRMGNEKGPLHRSGPQSVYRPVGLTAARLRRGQQAFTLGALAGQLAGAAHGFRLLASALFRGLLVVNVTLHFAEVAFALHLLLQGLQGLIDVVVTYKNLNQGRLSIVASAAPIRPLEGGAGRT